MSDVCPMVLSFQSGTLLLQNAPDDLPGEAGKFFTFDSRTGVMTARACDYAEIVMALIKNNCTVTDAAAEYARLDELALKKTLVLRPHQSEAMNNWISNCKSSC